MPDNQLTLPNQSGAVPVSVTAPAGPSPNETVPVSITAPPDGGVLGQAALGALKSAASGGAEETPPAMEGIPQNEIPPIMEGVPQSASSSEEESTTSESKPSFLSRVGHAANVLAFEAIPGLADTHNAANAVRDWADKELQKSSVNLSPYKTLGTGMLRDTADMVAQTATPEGLAKTGGLLTAGILLPIPTGLYMIGHGTYNMVQGWGDISNPDVMQNELFSAAEAVGGAATLGEGMVQSTRRIQANRAKAAPDLKYQDFKNAIPPTARSPYTYLDWQHAEPFLDKQNISGTPITDVSSTIDAANDAIFEQDNKISTVIKATPDEPINTDVLGAVSKALDGHPSIGFYSEGMKSLEKYRLGFERSGGATDPPLTLEKADEIRHQMNAETTAMKKALNNHDFANLISTNPAFAARVAAAEALRSGIADTLSRLGLKDAQLIRLNQGSLIKIRNAAETKLYGGETPIRTGTKPGLARRVVQKAALGAGAAAGFELGAKVGHPLIGSAIGAELGGEAAKAIAPERLTRNQLIERAFSPQPKAPTTAPVRISPNVVGGAITGTIGHEGQELPNDSVHIRGSDGSEYVIPASQLGHAFDTDPNLQILRSR